MNLLKFVNRPLIILKDIYGLYNKKKKGWIDMAHNFIVQVKLNVTIKTFCTNHRFQYFCPTF